MIPRSDVLDPPEPCNACGRERLRYTPDPCINGYLPGVAHACCGHGDIGAAYVLGWPDCKPDEMAWWDGDAPAGKWHLKGVEAVDYIQSHKGFARKGAEGGES